MLRPKQLIIEATNRCNLQCKYCPSVCNDGKFPIGDMSYNFFKSIVDRVTLEFPDTTIIPWMNGEPFLNPNYHLMVAYLNEKKRRFYVTTNLTIWRDDVLLELLKPGSGCYQLIVSMDGLAGTGSIAKARPGTSEELLLKNMNRLLRLRADLDSQTQIAVKICERGQDWQEIEEYIQYWLADSSIEYVCVGKPLKDLNETSMRIYPCQYFDNNFMVIRWTGDLTICAYSDEAANNLALSYGKVTESNSLLGLYNNDAIKQLREDQNNKIFHKPCEACSFAYTGFGADGEIAFRSNPKEVYHHRFDYYNNFFSQKEDHKSTSYYFPNGGLKDGNR